jgi:predicted permease
MVKKELHVYKNMISSVIYLKLFSVYNFQLFLKIKESYEHSRAAEIPLRGRMRSAGRQLDSSDLAYY